MSRHTMLGVWAHPDDEAYLSAGLMAGLRRDGHQVVVVTATLGERGTDDAAQWPPHRLAPLRHRELCGSLAALDVHDLHLLGLPDGQCEAHDGTARIAAIIEAVAPDLIVTFGPDGMTGHPDHRAVSRWTTNAWRATASPATLWYPTLTDDLHRRWEPVNEHVGLWGDQPDPPCTPDDEIALRLDLDDELLDRKIAALNAHASQTRPLVELLGPQTFRRWWSTETFRAASPSDHAVEGASA